MTRQRLIAFIRLGRPQFLAGGFVMHALGVAIAVYSGAALNLAALLWGQIAISAIQWMTHYSNDYFDLAADRANTTPTNWSGGSRVLADGLLPPRLALTTARILAGVAVIAALMLAFVVKTGALIIPLIALGLLLAWCYSAPPIRLLSHGLGELTTALLVPGLVPLIGFYLQRGRIDLLPILAIFPIGCLQFCMLLAIEFPDEAGDRAVNKRTLVVRLGAAHAAWLYIAVLVLAYAALPVLVSAGLPPLAGLAVALMSPLAIWLIGHVWRGEYRQPESWNRFSFLSIALLFGTAVAEVIAFVLVIGGLA